MPTIEAISYGKYILGFNDATMNEYIKDERVGKLYSDTATKIDVSYITKNSNFRNEYANKKYNSWLKDKDEINRFFLKEYIKKRNINLFLKIIFILDDIKNFVKTIMKRNYYKYKDGK